MPASAAELFDGLAPDHDADGSHAALAEALVALAARSLHHPRFVLDVGTGTGAAAFAAARAFPDATVTGLDISAAMIQRARSATEIGADLSAGSSRHDLPRQSWGKLRWVCAPAVPFPAADQSADLVLCASTLHFLGRPALADWQRLLRRGGQAAFTLPWRDRFRPGPAFAGLLPADDQQLPLPGSEAEAGEMVFDGFETIALAAQQMAALFVVRKLGGN